VVLNASFVRDVGTLHSEPSLSQNGTFNKENANNSTQSCECAVPKKSTEHPGYGRQILYGGARPGEIRLELVVAARNGRPYPLTTFKGAVSCVTLRLHPARFHLPSDKYHKDHAAELTHFLAKARSRKTKRDGTPGGDAKYSMAAVTPSKTSLDLVAAARHAALFMTTSKELHQGALNSSDVRRAWVVLSRARAAQDVSGLMSRHA